MSDFSLFSLFTAGLACLVPYVSAYTKPVGDSPVGNPFITPGLHDVVPVGKKYGITWKPTTPSDGTVSLVLLMGPPENAQPQYAIVEGIENTGNYIWTPSNQLADSLGDTGYGIQLIVDATGQYQYTTQFGISNTDYNPETDNHPPKPDGNGPKPGHYGGHEAESTSAPVYSGSTSYSHGAYATGKPSGFNPGYGHNGTNPHVPKPTGGSWETKNVTMPHATTHKTVAAPSASLPPAPSAPAPSATGGASSIAGSIGGLVIAAGVAVFAL